MDSGFAALIGALIGGGSTVSAQYFISKSQRRQQRIQAATSLAIKEHEFDVALRAEGKKLKYSLLGEYVAYHDAALARLDHGLQNTPDVLEELAKKYGVV